MKFDSQSCHYTNLFWIKFCVKLCFVHLFGIWLISYSFHVQFVMFLLVIAASSILVPIDIFSCEETTNLNQISQKIKTKTNLSSILISDSWQENETFNTATHKGEDIKGVHKKNPTNAISRLLNHEIPQKMKSIFKRKSTNHANF